VLPRTDDPCLVAVLARMTGLQGSDIARLIARLLDGIPRERAGNSPPADLGAYQGPR
jgi:hypothetical protein